MSVGEFAPPGGQTPRSETQDVSNVLSSDFYNSFRFSQGAPELQLLLLAELNEHYRHWPESTRACIPEALSNTVSRLESLAPPRGHDKVLGNLGEAAEYHQEFGFIFRAFNMILTADDPFVGVRRSQGIRIPADRDVRLTRIARAIVARDLAIIPRGRYNRYDSAQSYTRDYLLEQQPTRSAAYDAIFRDARVRLLHAKPRKQLPYLERLWEEKHPGQSFYSKALLAAEPEFAQNVPQISWFGRLLYKLAG